MGRGKRNAYPIITFEILRIQKIALEESYFKCQNFRELDLKRQ